ncbi:MAG: PqiC family protein [Puniceicoccales bacterium]|nr:PqiC family protein [Puniceicoccales bacterium]
MNKLCTLFIGLLFCGCTVFPPKPDLACYYVLNPAAAGSPRNADELRPKIALQVGRVQLPAYLDRQEIVTRSSAQQLAVHDTQRWLEPLGKACTRVFAHDLAQRLGAKLMTHGLILDSLPNTPQGIEVRMEIYQFDGPVDGKVTLRARWILIDQWGSIMGKDSAGITHFAGQGEVSEKIASAGKEAIPVYVDAMSKAVDALAGLVAQDIREMSAPRNNLQANTPAKSNP